MEGSRMGGAFLWSKDWFWGEGDEAKEREVEGRFGVWFPSYSWQMGEVWDRVDEVKKGTRTRMIYSEIQASPGIAS